MINVDGIPLKFQQPVSKYITNLVMELDNKEQVLLSKIVLILDKGMV